MQARQNKWINWRIVGGAIVLVSGFFTIFALNFDSSVYLPVDVALALAGITLCLMGIKLLLMGTAETNPVNAQGTELGRLQLNGYSLVAYESETEDGRKRFRLAAVTPLTAQQEAALIRYLALEGFLSSLWPEMRDRIEKEADWAFLV